MYDGGKGCLNNPTQGYLTGRGKVHLDKLKHIMSRTERQKSFMGHQHRPSLYKSLMIILKTSTKMYM